MSDKEVEELKDEIQAIKGSLRKWEVATQLSRFDWAERFQCERAYDTTDYEKFHFYAELVELRIIKILKQKELELCQIKTTK